MRVRCLEQGPVWRVVLAADARGQALIDGESTAALAAILDRLEGETSCRVLVLEGEAGSFCEGLDLSRLLEGETATVAPAVHAFADCLTRLHRARPVIIAAVDGAAAGGGIALAAAADALLATARSTFALPEVFLGVIPGVVLPLLLERMPPQKARLLALRGGVDAARAQALGLVDETVATPEALESALRALIKQALRASPAAVDDLKRLVRDLAGLDTPAALGRGAEHSAAILADPERRRGLRAFLEGGLPDWFARYRGNPDG